jgi:RHS repeat-associated protein
MHGGTGAEARGGTQPGQEASGPGGQGQDQAQGQTDKPSMLPAITTPKGGGAIKGIGEKFEVAAATGTASLSVPLPVSPGRGGFGPAVGLSYDSGHGNGPFGLGFALSVPTITRKTDKGLPRYYDVEESDEYILSGAEDLVPNRKPDGTLDINPSPSGDRMIQQYRPRSEGLFARIQRHIMTADGSIHWEVTTKDNVTHVYGRSNATTFQGRNLPEPRIFDPKDPTRIFTWLLEESRDDRGNVVRYEYIAEDGKGVDLAKPSERARFEAQGPGQPYKFIATAQRYLKRVLYTNFTATVADDFLFELVFDYGDHSSPDAPTPTPDIDWPVRIDPFSSYRSGFEVRTYRLCKRVLMFHRLSETVPRSALLVRSTDFFYDPTPAFTYLTSVIQYGYLFDAASPPNVTKSPMPTLALDYVRPLVNDQLSVLPPDSLEGLTGGVDGGKKQWVDLDGEGIPGVLIDEQTAWFYKSNDGGGQLAAPRVLPTMPSPATLAGGMQQLQDLGGDGQLDLVSYGEPLVGYASRTPDGDFDPLRTFQAIPNLDWHDPDLRFVDLDGDGLPDLLITEDQAFIWYRSLAKEGFEQAQRVAVGSDQDRSPTLAYTDDTQAIQLTDMSGDGLVDIVRVRNGEVSYWPNLGYGRFGAKVTLENSPVLAQQEEFDPRRVRFGDVDGTGTSDLFYLGRNETKLFFNQSGNALSPATVVTSLPPMDGAARVDVVDLLGTGTASLVWSSPLPGVQGRQIMYVDLMASTKPHLLKSIVNNLGATKLMTYAPSTKFYLEDKAAGIKWLTRLSFPVHVVAQIDHLDAISNSHLTSLYRYRHGFFDGVEREFRGFAYVEQVDAEAFTLGPDTTEFQPPTRTKTWFHTGAWLERETLETALANEYSKAIPLNMLLPDTIIPSGMTIQDEREAMRTLRGNMLHQEVYADDENDPNVGPIKAGLPFAATEKSFEVRLLQTSTGARHGVFFVFPRETIAIHTERTPNDPRVTHEFVMDVDDFGNVTRKAAVAYGRDPALAAQPEQTKAWATLHEADFINHPGDDYYRLDLPFGVRAFELTGLTVPIGGQDLVDGKMFRDIVIALDPAHDIPYEGTPTGTGVERRLLDSKRQLYYDEALATFAPLGATGSRALPFERYQLALTAGLVTQIGTDATTLTQGHFSAATLPGILTSTATDGGHYFQFADDTGYWTRSGRVVFDPTRFYLPTSLFDPFGQQSFVTYDTFNLLVMRAQDPLGNIVQAVNDYRVLAPSAVTDANLNRVEIAFDALGMVIKTAVEGKTTETFGDTLANPTIQLDYDLLRWQTQAKPVVVHTMARETHGTSPPPRFQQSYAYSDGFGRVAMTKLQAEPGPLFDAAGNQLPGPDANPRWVGTGRIVFNNKGNPVKQYEPFFSATFEFEDEPTVVQAGVTSIIHYDALDRVVRTELPNKTQSRVAFDVWTQTASDPNDTVISTQWWIQRGSPQPTDPEPTNPETRAAWLAARHDSTPTTTYFDALGRPFLVVENNRTYAETGNTFTEELLQTRTFVDVEGNALQIFDPRLGLASPPKPALKQRFDVLSRPQFSDSVDAGKRLLLADVAGKPIRNWDSRTQVFRHKYDELQRPTHLFVTKTVGEASGLEGQVPDDQNEHLRIRTFYGETLDPAGPAPTVAPGSTAQGLNVRGQAYLIYDCAGKVKNDQFDFKANLLSTTRRLAQEFKGEPDWALIDGPMSPPVAEGLADVQLESTSTFSPPTLNVFLTMNEYDALNRITKHTTPDSSVTIPTYNEAGLLERVSVGVRTAPPTVVVSNVDYNARGQRVLYEYADPTNAAGPITCRVSYTYDPLTFRLTNLKTNRVGGTAAKLQDLLYTYDPVGNVVELDDSADTAPIFNTTPVSGNGFYRYDSIYRLIHAEGREHPGQVLPTQPRGGFEFPPENVPHRNDLAALIRYKEVYTYDRNGNITQMQHLAAASPISNWTRSYNYDPGSNQLTDNNDPDATATGGTAAYTYTANGAMKTMLHLPVIDWDYADRLKHANKGPGGGDVYFTYDGGGQRVRKVWLKDNPGNPIDERIYIGGWETFRQRTTGPITNPPTSERETLHVMDGQRRIAMVETKTIGPPPNDSRWRFQLTNLLSSSVMELDAQGNVITYEEYHPYGTTAFHSSGDPNLSDKRYRYTGKEKDEETSLYYHGARYYVPWLGRWTAADPAGTEDALNLYGYARNNPIVRSDPGGRQSVSTEYEELVGASFQEEHVSTPDPRTPTTRERTEGRSIRAIQNKGPRPNSYDVGPPRTAFQALYNWWKDFELNIPPGSFHPPYAPMLSPEEEQAQQHWMSVRAEARKNRPEDPRPTEAKIHEFVQQVGPKRGIDAVVGVFSNIGDPYEMTKHGLDAAEWGVSTYFTAKLLWAPLKLVAPYEAGSPGKFLFSSVSPITDAEIEAGFANRNLGPLVELPAKNLIDAGPVSGGPKGAIWWHDNLRFAGILGAPRGRPVEVRVHAENREFPGSGYTMQINTFVKKRSHGPSFYRTPEGTWHLIDKNNQPLMLRLHIPAGN